MHAILRACLLHRSNRGMTVKAAAKEVAEKFGAQMNAFRSKYVQQKIEDASSAEGGAGGHMPTTAGTPEVGSNDLRLGKVLERARARLAASDTA